MTRVLICGVAAAAILAGPWLVPVDRDGWRFGATLVGGLAGGSLLAALLGRLLSRAWLETVEDELLPAAATLGLVALAAIGAAATPGMLPVPPDWASGEGWFATGAIVARLALLIAVAGGVTLAMLLTTGHRFALAAVALPIVAALMTLVVMDWVTLRPPVWWTMLQPVGFVVNQLTAALALAFVVNLLQRERAGARAFASLATALFSLALLDLWIGWVQYAVAWYANLPAGAAYYQVRQGLAPAAMPLAIACHLVGIAILLVRRSNATLLTAALLLLVAQLAHAIWLAGPVAPDGLAGWAPVAAMVVAAGVWIAAIGGWFDARIARRAAFAASE